MHMDPKGETTEKVVFRRNKQRHSMIRSKVKDGDQIYAGHMRSKPGRQKLRYNKEQAK